MTRAIDKTRACASMAEVRERIDALDDILVPLLVERGGYMTQAAINKPRADLVRDDERIEAIVRRVRARAAQEGGEPDVIEAIYRSMMEAYIDYEHREFARVRAPETQP